MMLQVLEKRETLRVKRFEELGRLLVDLRYVFGIDLSGEFTQTVRTAVQDSKSPVRQTANLPTMTSPPSDGFRLKITRTRTSHTRETLAVGNHAFSQWLVVYGCSRTGRRITSDFHD